MATPTAYLTNEYMQSMTSKKKNDDDAEFAEVEGAPKYASEEEMDAPVEYSAAVETLTHDTEEDESNLKQVEAKVLDFN